MNSLKIFFSLMQKGGVVNYVILSLYVVVLISSVERMVYYILSHYKKEVLHKRIKDWDYILIAKKNIESKDIDTSGLENSAIPEIVDTFVKHQTAGLTVLEHTWDRCIAKIIQRQEKGTVLLSRISAVAPLLGLLGTVTGLMSAFQKIAKLGGGVDISMLSGGIWEAMITTATGLVTAVFAFAFYELFDWFNMRRIRDFEMIVSLFSQSIEKKEILNETV